MLSLGYLLGLVLLPKLFYLSRLWCSGVAACLWLGDNIEILSMEKRAHLFYSNMITVKIEFPFLEPRRETGWISIL